jgi:hypothetical protein
VIFNPQLKEELKMQREMTQFKAQPNKIATSKPFIPKKSTKPMTGTEKNRCRFRVVHLQQGCARFCYIRPHSNFSYDHEGQLTCSCNILFIMTSGSSI